MSEFKKLSPTAPVRIARRMFGDHITPVGAFARLRKQSPRAFLLESVVGGEQIARYSFVGADPVAVLKVSGVNGVIEKKGQPDELLKNISDPLEILHNFLKPSMSASKQTDAEFGIPMPKFTGGAVGYAGYDIVRYYEPLPGPASRDRNLADMEFAIYDQLVVFDHVNKSMIVIAHAQPGSDPDSAYYTTTQRIDGIVALLSAPADPLNRELGWEAPAESASNSTWNRAGFESAVIRAQEYIAAGDIFQVVLSRRVSTITSADPFDVYRALRVVNPSPFMFYLQSPDCVLVGASPEILCRVEDGVITNRPLAGTRRRGKSVEEDARLEQELLADPKDRAEHIMLVDLGRNDIGRVAVPGSIQLSDVLSVERYSHVMHLSSQVRGKLAPNKTAMDALRACLPVGTVSGAPKVRAMQIIDELEPHARGPYGGGVGYFDFAGNMDMCIALRTIVVTPDKSGGWRYDVQAGAGIVADSKPDLEFEETVNKSRAMLTAIAMATQSGA